MKSVFVRSSVALAILVFLQTLFASTALAHTGEDATTGHVLVEFGRWALGVTAVLAAIVAAFWLRNKVWKR